MKIPVWNLGSVIQVKRYSVQQQINIGKNSTFKETPIPPWYSYKITEDTIIILTLDMNVGIITGIIFQISCPTVLAKRNTEAQIRLVQVK